MSKDSSVPSDGRLYGRLLRYAFAYKLSLLLSFLGYLVYSIGSVLLADLTQFLLDSLGEQRNGMGLGFVAQASM